MGKACTFFGHRDCPASMNPELRKVLAGLIENHGVDTFYVGRQGAFDRMAVSALGGLAKVYPHISIAVVLERIPSGHNEYPDTILPEGIESVHPRFAIAWRSRWMIQKSAYIVTFITHS